MRIAVVTVSVSFITSGSFPYKRSKKNVDGGKAIPSSGRNRHYNFKQFFSHYINLPKFILRAAGGCQSPDRDSGNQKVGD